MVGSSKKFVFAWYLHALFSELVLIYPVYAIMMGEAGITPFELSVLLCVWSATTVLLEVPTGTIADRYPRRWVVILGFVLKSCCFLWWLMFPNWLGFLGGFICWGVGGSLRSGASEALLFDSMVELQDGESFETVLGRTEAVRASTVTVAMALGGWLSSGGYALPLALSIAAPLAAAAVMWGLIPEPARHRELPSGESFAATLTAGFLETTRNPSLRVPIILLCTAGLAYDSGEEYFGPLLVEGGFSLASVGLVTAVAHAGMALGALSAGRFARRGIGTISLLYWFAAILLAGTVASLSRPLVATALLTSFVVLTSAAQVILRGRLQRAIEGHARATVTSVVEMGRELGSVGVFLLLGGIASMRGWSSSFFVLASLLGACAMISGFLIRDHRS